jgi:hypothetical protein
VGERWLQSFRSRLTIASAGLTRCQAGALSSLHDRVTTWIANIGAAIDLLRRETGVSEVALVGLRLGGCSRHARPPRAAMFRVLPFWPRRIPGKPMCASCKRSRIYSSRRMRVRPRLMGWRSPAFAWRAKPFTILRTRLAADAALYRAARAAHAPGQFVSKAAREETQRVRSDRGGSVRRLCTDDAIRRRRSCRAKRLRS